jgi:hypothetical protein
MVKARFVSLQAAENFANGWRPSLGGEREERGSHQTARIARRWLREPHGPRGPVRHKLLFRAKREYPFSEQFQVIAAGSEGGISYHHLTTRPGEGEEGFQQEDLGQSVFGVGCRVENLVQYHMTGSEGSWISSASHVGTQGWSEMSVVLDTQSDTVNVGVRAYDDLTATLGSSVSILTGQSLGVNADAVTELRWDFRSGTLDNGAEL